MYFYLLDTVVRSQALCLLSVKAKTFPKTVSIKISVGPEMGSSYGTRCFGESHKISLVGINPGVLELILVITGFICNFSCSSTGMLWLSAE